MRVFIAFCMALALSGCHINNQAPSMVAMEGESGPFQAQMRVGAFNDYLMDEYVEQMATRLVTAIPELETEYSVAIASFVDLDNSLNTTSRLGNQLSETFITEIRRLGVPVVDYKMNSHIDVLQSGDIVFTRDKGSVNNDFDYILAGTFIYDEKGVVVHARIISRLDKRIIGATHSLIPYQLVY